MKLSVLQFDIPTAEAQPKYILRLSPWGYWRGNGNMFGHFNWMSWDARQSLSHKRRRVTKSARR